MIGLGFILMGFGITVPAIYWVIAILVLFLGACIIAAINPDNKGGDMFYGFSQLIMVILLHFIFPDLTFMWWMWLYFIILGVGSVFTTIFNS